MHILIVDDNPVVRFVHQRILKDLAKIDLAENAKTAIELHKQNHYDMILLDVNLPDMDGIEAAKAMLLADYRVKIYGITSQTKPGTKAACRAAGMEDVYNKPITAAELQALVLDNK